MAASRQHCSVILVEPKRHVGGVSAGGLGETDVGRPMAITGLARQFYRDLGRHYGVFEAWTFEPHVAEAQYLHYLEKRTCPHAASAARRVRREKRRAHSEHHRRTFRCVLAVEREGLEKIHAKVFIDCTYEGDLMARAGVSYAIGREANSVYGETKNGVEPGPRHQFPDGVDPYIKEGDPSSGLIFGVSPEPLAPTGTGDKKVQAYCFRLCLTKNPENQIPFTRPDSYDPAKYELSRRLIRAGHPKSLSSLLIISGMPNQKTDINSLAGQSTDFYGANWSYPDGDYTERARIWKDHEEYTKGLVWFLATDEAVPENIRMQMRDYGWPLDEYKDNHGFTHELYVREARRMVGEYIMTEHDCLSQRVPEDGIAFASYNMDAHHTQTVIVNGMVKNEGEVTVHLDREYPVSYRALLPKREECDNLLVPVCLSASHIAYGSIRMEPVFMSLGQAAGIAAGMAAQRRTSVQDLDVPALRRALESRPVYGRPRGGCALPLVAPGRSGRARRRLDRGRGDRVLGVQREIPALREAGGAPAAAAFPSQSRSRRHLRRRVLQSRLHASIEAGNRSPFRFAMRTEKKDRRIRSRRSFHVELAHFFPGPIPLPARSRRRGGTHCRWPRCSRAGHDDQPDRKILPTLRPCHMRLFPNCPTTMSRRNQLWLRASCLPPFLRGRQDAGSATCSSLRLQIKSA